MKTILKKALQDNDNILFAYLFGSQTNGTATDESDIDIAIFFQENSLDAKLSIIHELQKLLHKEIDLVSLNEVKNIFLLDDILTHGIVIKDHDDRLYFEVRKEHEILDFKEYMRYIDAA